jgi:hypothetical protein
MFFLGLFLGGAVGFMACAILAVGDKSEVPESEEDIYWRKRTILAESKVKRLNQKLDKMQDKLKLAELTLRGSDSGEKEQKERVHK